MRPMHTDKSGRPIEMEEWARLLEDKAYRVVAKTQVGEHEVSTVWVGLAPLPFETLVFPGYTDMDRYATEEQAKKGHEEIVARVHERYLFGEPVAE